jgi:glyoxylase-like metal-dependent hydrolase (beta-lactamase superfamily II)
VGRSLRRPRSLDYWGCGGDSVGAAETRATDMNTLADGLSYVDLRFHGMPRVIAAGVLYGPGGAALVDPGPSSTLPILRAALASAGIAIADVTALLLTHIHLDHAGASGTLVRENPRLRVYVHANGAPHLIDPRKLLVSATRLYGEEMDRLWGEVQPVPSNAVVTLRGGERLEAGGRQLDVAYTPGHASHHLCYFSGDTGIAFVGDAAGIRIAPRGYVVPPTAPPDVDLDAWRQSVARIEAWAPETLFVTHFGAWSPVAPHLAEFGEHLDLSSRLVHSSLTREGTDEAREGWFVDEMRRELRQRMDEADVLTYEVATRLDLNWKGLARYWRKRSG